MLRLPATALPRPVPHSAARRRVLGTLALSALAAGISRAYAQGSSLCGPTAPTTAGPFYVSGTPLLADINRLGASGTPMRVRGTVFGGDGTQPLATAIVELWHCDAEGHYHPADQGGMADFADDAINLRGTAVSDAQGEYRFDSIVPGHYGNRRRHLHWRISAPGHRTLVTQSYWREERHTARESRDFVDRNTEDCRWVAFARGADGRMEGRFDVVLEPLA